MTDPAPEYVAARTVLIDALAALGSQRKAIIVVGAQAIYMHTEDGGIAGYSPYTTDADLALAPSWLADEPHIEKLLEDASFEQKGDPGIWWKTTTVDGTPRDVEVDIMVPEHFAPASGRRSVRLPPHDKMIVRKAIGLEGAILDHDLMEVAALDGSDPRRFTVRVAGPAALVVAKVYKLRDRLVGRGAVDLMVQLFGSRDADGVRMARDALRIAVPPERIIDVCTGFIRQLREAMSDA